MLEEIAAVVNGAWWVGLISTRGGESLWNI
jgi:hypothetical protein